MCVCACVCVCVCVLCVCVCVLCVCSMDSQTAECIMMKICRHDPWVSTTVIYNKISKYHPLWGEGDFNFPFKRKALKTWLSGYSTGLSR